MSFRVVPKKLARPAAHTGVAATTTTTSSSSPAPVSKALLQFPVFRPTPFQHDKFLSIKTRSLETYTKLRGDVLQRCAELRSQIQRRQERAVRRSGADAVLSLHGEAAVMSSSSSAPLPAVEAPDVPRLPLTPHQAEELLLLSKKVESLTDFQGLVLTDELVWRMFHLCVHCGAPQQALDCWLQKHILAEQRGPPYPLFLVEDLATLLRSFVLSRLPECGASLSCCSSLLLSGSGASGDGVTALEDGFVAAQRYLQLCCMGVEDGAATAQDNRRDCYPEFGQLYAADMMNRFVWPVWRSLESMNLTLNALKSTDEQQDSEGVEDEPGGGGAEGEEAQVISGTVRTTEQAVTVVRSTLMSVTPLYSLHEQAASPSTHASADCAGSERQTAKQAASNHARAVMALDPPSFSNEVEAVVAPLRALLDVWLAVAQCASEAKDTRLLCEVQRTVSAGFLQSAPAVHPHSVNTDSAPTLTCTLNEAVWCSYSPPVAASHAPLSASETACQNAAETCAREVVRSFIGDALSVIEYGLLCAEQERVLWQMHDTSAILLGCSSMLKRWRDASYSPDKAKLPRRLQAIAVAPHETPEEAERILLCRVLPHALRAVVRKSREQAHSGDKAMVESVRAFLSQTVASSSAAVNESTTLSYADAGIYVGIATGDETLLRDAGAAASIPERDVAVLRLTSQLLHRHRCAVAALAHAGSDTAGATAPSPSVSAVEEDIWTRVQALTASNDFKGNDDVNIIGGDAAAVVRLTPQLREGCLQALVLDIARRQTECATAYVQAVFSSGHPSTNVAAGEGDEGEHLSDEGSETDTTADAHSLGTDGVTEARLEVAKEAWVDLHAKMSHNIVDGLERVALLLMPSTTPSASLSRVASDAPCLSPSALSSMAVLARVGIYLEQEASGSSLEKTSSLSTSLNTILTRLALDASTLFQEALLLSAETTSSSFVAGPSTAISGTWVQWVLVALMSRRDWASVLVVLKAMDGCPAGLPGGKGDKSTPSLSSSPSLLCAATVDPAVFAAIYARAMEDGAASVCAFLRPRREALFF
jgi:hypothetical protein